MILNEARDIRFGSTAVQRVCLGEKTIWRRYTDMMPVMADVTAYFEHTKGFSEQSWKNQVGDTDIAFSGTVSKNDSRIRLEAGASGVYPGGRLPERFTIYLIARTEETSFIRGQYLLSNAHIGSETAGIEISTGGNAHSRMAFRSVSGADITTLVPGNEFHVLAVSVDGQSARCFADGEMLGTMAFLHSDLLCMYLGRQQEHVCEHANEYKFMAYAESAHSDDAVICNSEWLIQRFGITKLDYQQFYFPEYLETTGTQYLYLNYVQQTLFMRFDAKLTIDQMTEDFCYILRSFPRFRLFIRRTESDHPQLCFSDYYTELCVEDPTMAFGDTVNIGVELSMDSSRLFAQNSSTDGIGFHPVALAGTAYTFLQQDNNNIGGTGIHGKIHELQLCDNGFIVRDVIPAVRKSDGKTGMYDFVLHEFFYNIGSEEFLYPEPV